MDKDKQNNKLIRYILIGLTVYIFLVVLSYILNFNHLNISKNDPTEWGAFGDYIGGLLNPTLAFLSFIGVLWTLKMSREELVETRSVMDAQLKTQSLQQFDSLYILMINQLDSIFTKIESSELIDYIADFKTLGIVQAQIEKNQNFCRYKNYVEAILEKIDNSKLTLNDKQTYVDLMLATIPDSYLKLMYFSFVDIDEPSDPSLIKRLADFKFFHKLKMITVFQSKLQFSLIYCIKLYPDDCFGQNIDFHKIKNTWYCKDIIQMEGYLSLLSCVANMICKYQYFECIDKSLKIIFSSQGNMFVHWNNAKIASINIGFVCFGDDYIRIEGGHAGVGFEYVLYIYEDSANLVLNGFSIQDLDIPECLKEEKLLYGIPRI